MARYDAKGELAPRDVVSRGIVAEMTHRRTVCLALMHLGADFVRRDFRESGKPV